MRIHRLAPAIVTLALGCGEPPADPVGTSTDGGSETGTAGDGDGDPGGDGDGDPSGDGDGDGFECDYEVGPNAVLMFEAESLAIVEDWQISADVAGHYGSGYLFWSGPSFNNQPGNALIEVELGVYEPGRYRVQWRNQIGMGIDPTEHNDVWLKFTNAADYYGKAGNDPETRRYPKPICDDANFITMIEALAQVSDAGCAQGSSSDGWMKVYSSGATQWKWSTRTSDSDAHDIYVEFDAPGAYTMQLSARADYLLLDRIVVHREDVGDDVAHAELQGETPCE